MTSSIAKDSTDKTKEGTYGPFTLKNGIIYNGKTALLQWFNDSIALVPLKVRRSLATVEKNEAFDQIVTDIKGFGAEIRYVDTIKGFMNPASRFADFMAGKGTSGVVLSEDELNLPALYTQVKNAFTKAFSPPPLPPPVYVRSTAKLTNVIRITGTHVTSGSYSMKLDVARSLFNKIYPYWLKNPPSSRVGHLTTFSSVAAGGLAKVPMLSVNRLSLGCQTFTRRQIEDLADRMNWWPKKEA